MPPRDAVAHLVGLQAQQPRDPYVALWSRLGGFDPDRLGRLLEEREVVRIVVMRATIHLVTADDCLALRPLIQPVLDAELARHREHAAALRGVDLDAVLAAARPVLAERPRTGPELRAALGERFPDHDPAALAYACRCLLPLVQVPPRGVWGRTAQVTTTTAEAWLGRPLATDPSIDEVVLRYLAAFGPASVARRRGVVAPDRAARGRRAAAPAACGRSATSAGASCSTCPTRPGPIPRRRRRRASCPSTTTCCSPTPTARGSCRRTTGAASPPRPGASRDGPARRNGARHLVGQPRRGRRAGRPSPAPARGVRAGRRGGGGAWADGADRAGDGPAGRPIRPGSLRRWPPPSIAARCGETPRITRGRSLMPSARVCEPDRPDAGRPRPALRAPPRPLRLLGPGRGMQDRAAPRPGRGDRPERRRAHRPRGHERRRRALPPGDQAGHHAGRRASRPTWSPDHRERPHAGAAQPPDAPRRDDRGLLQPHQALLGRLPRGLPPQAAHLARADGAPRRRHHRALRMPLGRGLLEPGARRPRRRPAPSSTRWPRSSGATTSTWRSSTRAWRSRPASTSTCAGWRGDTGLPMVATCDAHYPCREDADAHEALLAIQTRDLLSNPNRFRFETKEFYLKTGAEMAEALPDFLDALAGVAGDRRALRGARAAAGRRQAAPLPRARGRVDAEAYLERLCREGIARRYPAAGRPPSAEERLRFELVVIGEMGFASYFLIVWDYMRWARENGVGVGPGRGSAAGSLVAYALRIVDLDPLAHGLLFERFLNPGARACPTSTPTSPSPAATGWCSTSPRSTGPSAVARIGTFGKLLARAVVRDAGRVLGHTYGQVDRIAKLVPERPHRHPARGRDGAGHRAGPGLRRGPGHQGDHRHGPPPRGAGAQRGRPRRRRRDRPGRRHRLPARCGWTTRATWSPRCPTTTSRSLGPAEDGLPGPAQPRRHRGVPGAHRASAAARRSTSRPSRSTTRGDLRDARPGRRDRRLPVRVERHARGPPRGAPHRVRRPDRARRPLPPGPDGLHQHLRAQQARPLAGDLRGPAPRVDHRPHLRRRGLPGAAHGDLPRDRRVLARRAPTTCARPWARRTRS